MLRLLLLIFASSFLITGTFTFGYQIPTWRKLLPASRIFTLEQLKDFNGKVDGRPVYLAIDGKVFDVTAGKEKYIGSNYEIFLGRDASRSFATGCLNDPKQWTHDVRKLSSGQTKHLITWVEYYQRHPDYFQVGTVILPEPKGEVPGPCKSPSPQEMPHNGQRPPSAHY